MFFILRIFCFFAFVFASAEAGARPSECQMWEEVAVRTMDQEFLNVSCAASGLCTGFSCLGSLLFEFATLRGREPFGFSLEFIPCSYPLVLRLRINSSELEFLKVLGVHGRNEEEIILVTEAGEGEEKSYGRLSMSWNALLKPVKYFVALEINFTRIFMNGEFPPIPLVPLRNYPIPNCHYGPSSDVPVAKGKPIIHRCKGSECSTRSQNQVLYKPEENMDHDLILKVSVGAGALLVTLCVLVGVFLLRRRRRANALQKLRVDNDSNGESEEEGFEEDVESIPSPRGNDRRSLLKV